MSDTHVMIGSAGTISGNTFSGAGAGTITTTTAVRPTPKVNAQDILDQFALNEFVVEHRVQEQELLKLKELNVDYADAIKDTLAKNLSRDMVKKISFTKKFDDDTFCHSFRGRAWVFTQEELVKLVEDIKNGIR